MIDPFTTTGPAVIVLTKAPVPGRVKTRLMPQLGAQGAARLHEALVEATLDQAVQSGLPVGVSLAGDLAGAFAAGLRRRGLPVEAQASGDLGDRLRHALRGPGRRIALGTDCPIFDPAWLREAAALEAPVAFGPSEDGGYWTVAVAPPQDAVFTDVPWSTEQTLAVSLERARAAGLTPAMLPVCFDVDEAHDLQRLLEDPRCPPALHDLARTLLTRA